MEEALNPRRLKERVRALNLPLPLEPLLSEALRREPGPGKHRVLIQVLEVYLSLQAISLWAASAEAGLPTQGLLSTAGAHHPSLGHWCGLIGTAKKRHKQVLSSGVPAAVAVFQAVVDGLGTEIADESTPGLARFCRHLEQSGVLQPTSAKRGRRVRHVVDALADYRNRAHGHERVLRAEDELARAGEYLLAAVVELLELSPVLGGATLWGLASTELTGSGAIHRWSLLHGDKSVADLPSGELVGPAVPRRVYLSTAGRLLPLWPAVALTSATDTLAGELPCIITAVKARVAFDATYATHIERDPVQERLPQADYERLVGKRDPERGSEPLHTRANPYLGLEAFSPEDSDRFFGREDEVARIVSRLRTERLVLLAGPSGVGKTSLVMAGVLPTYSDACPTQPIVLRPGLHPMTALGRVLKSAYSSDGPVQGQAWNVKVNEGLAEDGGLADLLDALTPRGTCTMLVLDQLEELFVQCEEPAERERFWACISSLWSRDLPPTLAIILSIRSDYLDLIPRLGSGRGHTGLVNHLERRDRSVAQRRAPPRTLPRQGLDPL